MWWILFTFGAVILAVGGCLDWKEEKQDGYKDWPEYKPERKQGLNFDDED